MKILLKNGHVIDPVTRRDEILDILIVDGMIERLGSKISADRSVQTLDLKAKIVATGFIDMHVHLREPGFEHKETIATGCAAAAAGGFTAVCCMPNTNPTIDNEEVVRFIQKKAATVLDGLVDVYPIAAVTKAREGKELSPMAELVDAGVRAFSDDGAPVESAEILRRGMEYASMFDVPIIQHAEDRSMTQGGAIHEGFVSTSLGLPGMPSVAEETIIARDIAIAEYVNAKYHVAHISTAGSVEIIRQAKKKKLKVTCEVTPHHFTLTDEAVRTFNTNTKMNPPLRTKDDLEVICEGLRDGTIDVIATDHAPHTFDEKEVEFANAPFGIVGLETALGLVVTELIQKNILIWHQLVEKFSINPRKILELPPVSIREGEKANLTIIDPNVEWVVDVSKFKSKSKNSPFHGWKLKGKAAGVINNGVMYFG